MVILSIFFLHLPKWSFWYLISTCLHEGPTGFEQNMVLSHWKFSLGFLFSKETPSFVREHLSPMGLQVSRHRSMELITFWGVQLQVSNFFPPKIFNGDYTIDPSASRKRREFRNHSKPHQFSSSLLKKTLSLKDICTYIITYNNEGRALVKDGAGLTRENKKKKMHITAVSLHLSWQGLAFLI